MGRIRNRKAEGYIDICIGVICFVIVLVITINIFSFISLRTELDNICDSLLETATYTGEFGDEFYGKDSVLIMEHFRYDLDYDADRYFNETLERVQLGEKMWVEVSYRTYIKGLGAIRIPVTVTVRKSGLSERYWK